MVLQTLWETLSFWIYDLAQVMTKKKTKKKKPKKKHSILHYSTTKSLKGAPAKPG
jgi:hypothetical protein